MAAARWLNLVVVLAGMASAQTTTGDWLARYSEGDPTAPSFARPKALVVPPPEPLPAAAAMPLPAAAAMPLPAAAATPLPAEAATPLPAAAATPLPPAFPARAQSMTLRFPLKEEAIGDKTANEPGWVRLEGIPRRAVRTAGNTALVGGVAALALTGPAALPLAAASGAATAMMRGKFDAACWMPAPSCVHGCTTQQPWTSVVAFSKDEYGASGAPAAPMRGGLGGLAHYADTLASVAKNANALVCAPLSTPKSLYGKALDLNDMLAHLRGVLAEDAPSDDEKSLRAAHWRVLGSPRNTAGASRALHIAGEGRQGALAALVAASYAERDERLGGDGDTTQTAIPERVLRSVFVTAPSTLGVAGNSSLADVMTDNKLLHVDKTPALFLSGDADQVYQYTDTGGHDTGLWHAFAKSGTSPRAAVELFGGGHCWLRDEAGALDARSTCATGKLAGSRARLPADAQHALGAAMLASWIESQTALSLDGSAATRDWVASWQLPWPDVATVAVNP